MGKASPAEVVRLQRRILLAATVILLIGFVLWIIAMATDSWYTVDGHGGIFVPKRNRYFLRSNSGIWRTCRNAFKNATKTEIILNRCTAHAIFFSSKDQNATFIGYQKTIAAISIVSTIVMVMGLAFAVYTFKQTRYMYKRLAAAAHFVSGVCLLIVLEVTISLVNFEEREMPSRQPPGSTRSYGYSFALAWMAFGTEVVACIAFAVCSRKKKKAKAPNERFAIEEEPTIIGR